MNGCPLFSDVTNGRHFDELDAQDMETIRYGCADSDFALQLYHIFNSWFDRFLPKHRYLVEEIESPAAVYLGLMKYNGVPVNADLMKVRQQEAEQQMQRIRNEITMLIGDISIGANCSTKAFKDYLYQTLKLPVMKVTASNREAADDASMILLKEWCDANRPELSPLFTLVQEYRKWSKIKSTYIDGYLKYLNSATGRIHPDFFALSTETGRMNCRNPNLQNCPRKSNDPIGVRNFIQAPEKSSDLVSRFFANRTACGSILLPGQDDDGNLSERRGYSCGNHCRHFWLYLCRSTKQASTGIQGTAYHRQERELWHILRAISKGTAEHIEVQGRRREIYTGM